MRIVQVGANKGNTDNDPVWKLVQANLPDSLNWSIVLIEPNPYAVKILRETYKGFSNAHILECACGDETGVSTLYVDHLDDESSSQHSSLIYDHLIRHEHKPEVIGLVSVKIYKLGDLIDSSCQIDLLQIDAEGYDYKVLLGCDFGKFDIKQVQYEHMHLKGGEKEMAHHYMIGHGYKLIRANIVDSIYERV
jgi:FkbM family methyltransferase